MVRYSVFRLLRDAKVFNTCVKRKNENLGFPGGGGVMSGNE